MRKPDRAQRKIAAGFFEKFAVALATAVSAKVFFAEEGLTVMTYCAVAVMIVSFIMSMLLAHGTDEKPKEDVMRTEVKKGVFHVEKAEIRPQV